MIEARYAAEEGDAAAALESVRAVKGLADHLSEVETPLVTASFEWGAEPERQNFGMQRLNDLVVFAQRNSRAVDRTQEGRDAFCF